jgi:hypothetical protein
LIRRQGQHTLEQPNKEPGLLLHEISRDEIETGSANQLTTEIISFVKGTENRMCECSRVNWP